MSLKLFRHSPRFSVVVISLVGALTQTAAESRATDEFQYFKSDEIDFWSGKKNENPQGNPAALLTTEISPESTRFPWKKYLDPRNDEFFKEGDYIPPAPFMEIARNPSDENIANWFRYLETKNTITQRLQKRLETYTASQNRSAPETAPMRKAGNPRELALDQAAKRFRLRLYFDSTCPHCQKMIGTLSELAQMGFSIELRQTDSDLSARRRIPFPVTSASPSELKQYQLAAVPMLLVGDLKRGTFFKIQGYQSTDAVLQALRSESNPPEGGQS